MKHEHVRIAVSGSSVQGVEHVPAIALQDGCWELIRSPLYATQVAAGDAIRILDSDAGTFEVVRRGGNVSVQFYLGPEEANDAATTSIVARAIESDLALLRGRMDGMTAGLIVFSIPSESGFAAIEAVFESAARQHKGAEWQYGNVYDPVTEEPLRWWE